MKPFTEDERYNYPLTRDSVVLDCGAYHGDFAKQIWDQYHCSIHAFEPIGEFRKIASAKCGPERGVWFYPYGVGGLTRDVAFKLANDATGMFAQSSREDRVWIKDIDEVLAGFFYVDLLKLNIEGMEFETLERILTQGLTDKLKNIQVQFHPVVMDYVKRYDKIRAGLVKTHHLTFDKPWVWENWEKNS